MKPSVDAVLREAFRTGERVRITYDSQKKGRIQREIRPYEVDGPVLWATDTLHGAGRIHRFYRANIVAAVPVTNTSFAPRWPIQGFPGRLQAIRKGLKGVSRPP